jgi:exodeoxyribonuclease III
MKIISWNVNGIRAVATKGLSDFIKKEKPDILCLQETKISDVKREEHEFDFVNYKEYWHSAKRPGYSGTMILVKNGIKVLNFQNGLGEDRFDNEGRTITIELEKFFLVNVYFPNSNHELSRLDYKIDFNDSLLKHVKKLEKRKPVVVCGDFNVAHEEIDLARPKDNAGSAGFTKEERNWMTKFLDDGFVDTFRYKNGNKIQYSWWSYRFNARVKNIGWRIDYFCISKKLALEINKAYILNEVYGSDHCPVGLEAGF